MVVFSTVNTTMTFWPFYRLQLWQLDRQESRIKAAYSAERNTLRTNGASQTDLYRSLETEHFETIMVDDQRSHLKTERLIKSARRRDIPIPSWDDESAWAESQAFGYRYLTTKGFADLRSAVRKEQNEVWQFWELRFKIVAGIATALTGAFGAAIGLIAIFGKPPAP
jgi:hypothetical protein